VLLIDADMPDLDGIETLQRIAEDPNWHRAGGADGDRLRA
jgi:CheY-like chemotaxis protein